MGKGTLAVVGAGPGIGLAVAERFGAEGFDVALIARNQAALDDMAGRLTGQGIKAAGFAADVADERALKAALERAIAHFGSIDVLEYSPSPSAASIRTPRAIDVENELYHLQLVLLGAITAVQTVLPGMLERKRGSLLFTCPASAQYPIAMTGSAGVAAGAALNYARVLNQELGPDGIYAGFVSVAGFVVQRGEEQGRHPSGFPLVAAQDVADLHWDLHSKRDRVEAFAGDVTPLLGLQAS